MADLTVERTTDLDIGVEELWELISTADGWCSWLVDDAELVVTSGAGGTTTQDGVQRQVRIDTVADRRGIDFAWWDRDDPSSESHVRIDIVELPSGGSRLHVIERFVGASASIAVDVDVDWQVRFVSLWLLALHSTVLA